jgi:tartrate dehydrogenase/decarboxylase/D-malate dehydrogenase
VTHRVALLPGDGVGPEVIAEARRAVDALGLSLEWSELPWGSAYWHEHGRMMPADALETLERHDAVLMGAIGDPSVPDHVSLWGLVLEIRQRLDLWANVRPARLLEGVRCPLAERTPADVDMLFLRENTEGEYSGIGGRAHRGLDGEVAIESSVFTRGGVERVIRYAFELAAGRRGILTSATKSNASRYGYVLWDEVAEESAGSFRREVRARARRRARGSDGARPASLDVVVASNLFGDILTDLAAAIQGGMGMAASANSRPAPAARVVRAGARLGARHRRPGDRQPGRRDLERVAHARAPRRAGRGAGADAGARGCLPHGPRTRDLGGEAGTAESGQRSSTGSPRTRSKRSRRPGTVSGCMSSS